MATTVKEFYLDMRDGSATFEYDDDSVKTVRLDQSPVSGVASGVQRAVDGAYALDDTIISPLEIASCELWLDATSGPVKADWTACINDGDAVAQWTDNSGNNRHATVVSGTPTYKPTGGCNGRPGVSGRLSTPGFVATVLPRGDTGNNPRNTVNTAALNALIRANWNSFADGLADIAADARFTDYNNTTYFNADKVHLTDAGYAAAAQVFLPAIQAQLI